jgi:glycosyltransferase involved in cell wall biosynthesis
VTRRPTILQIIPRLDTGGAELSAIEISDAVVMAGGRSIIATEGGRMAERITLGGGEICTMAAGSKNPVRMAANAKLLANLIKSQSIDLVHARSRAPAWSALVAARHCKTPFVTTYHGAYAERGTFKRLYNSVMARSDVVIANSHYTKRLIQSRYRTSDARIQVIHRGVDEVAFDPANVTPERLYRLREHLGLQRGEPMILHAARLTSWKGQMVLIEAAGMLARAGKFGQAVVVLAGDAQGRTDYVRRLSADITRLGLQGRVRLGGHIDDIPAALMLAWVSVIASTEPEAFGRSVTEAAAMGCPVIATDIGAPPETVKAPPHTPLSAATGWLVPPGDATALSRHLEHALALSIEERTAMGERARRHVLDHFSLSQMRRATLQVYDKLLGTDLANRFEFNASAGNYAANA